MADRSGLPRPAPGTRGSKDSSMPMKTANWPAAPGSKGKGWGSSISGFKEVKAGAAQDMANDKGVMKNAVGKKIEKLMGEGKPQDQAVAMSLAMNRAHRLTKSGDYIRVKRK